MLVWKIKWTLTNATTAVAYIEFCMCWSINSICAWNLLNCVISSLVCSQCHITLLMCHVGLFLLLLGILNWFYVLFLHPY
jgi:hypothetical protein